MTSKHRISRLASVIGSLAVIAVVTASSCDRGDDGDGRGSDGAAGEDAALPLDVPADEGVPFEPQAGDGGAVGSAGRGEAPGSPRPATGPRGLLKEAYLLQPSRTRLLTPEQFSNVVARAFDLRRIATISEGRRRDWIVHSYGVELGGVDFDTIMERDEELSPQRILAMREVAFQLSDELVSRDVKRLESGAEPAFFRLANPSLHRPFHSGDLKQKADKQAELRAGEERWRAQVEETFRRLYHRPPREAEWAAVRESFLAVYLTEKRNIRRAWVITLMTLLMSMELWTV